MKIKLLILVMLCMVGCNSKEAIESDDDFLIGGTDSNSEGIYYTPDYTPDYTSDYMHEMPFPKIDPNQLLEITTTDYTIVKNEPNLLIVDVWDNSLVGGFMGLSPGVAMKTLRRVEITIPYIVVVHEPNHLIIHKFRK